MEDKNYWSDQGGSSNAPEPPYVSTSQTTQAFRSGSTGVMPEQPTNDTGYRYATDTPRNYEYSNTASSAAAAKKQSSFKTFALGFVGALLACVLAIGGFSAWQGAQARGIANNASNATNGTTLGAANSSTINANDENVTLAEAVAAKALPSVVYIGVYSQSSGYAMYGYPMGNSNSSELVESALGSGIILSEDGYILTNYHVVEGADALKVTIEGIEYEAEVVGTDASSDLAVIKAKDASGLTAADIGNSDDLVVGEWVMSVGCPFGLEQSVATGVVSATSRSRIVDNSSSGYGYGYGTAQPTLYPNMIQTDAAINPGNSGGALVDSEGKVIGVNTLIASYSGNYSGVGFAIPINYAINIAQQIIDGQTPTHAKLGVSLTNITSSVAKRYNLPVDYGAYVNEVVVDSGAAGAGIETGDIIIAMDGKKISTATDLTLAIRSHNPGDTVSITVNRNGENVDLSATLGSDEADLAAAQEQSEQGSQLFGNGNNGGDGSGSGGSQGYGNGNYSYEDLLRYLGLL